MFLCNLFIQFFSTYLFKIAQNKTFKRVLKSKIITSKTIFSAELYIFSIGSYFYREEFIIITVELKYQICCKKIASLLAI